MALASQLICSPFSTRCSIIACRHRQVVPDFMRLFDLSVSAFQTLVVAPPAMVSAGIKTTEGSNERERKIGRTHWYSRCRKQGRVRGVKCKKSCLDSLWRQLIFFRLCDELSTHRNYQGVPRRELHARPVGQSLFYFTPPLFPPVR